MSDDDDFMQDSEQEDYDFEYEDDDDEQGGDVDIENKYFNAKQMKLDQPEDAIDEFLGVPALEQEKGDWGFKGLKQAIKLEFKLKRYSKAVEHYQELLTYVKSAVTRNYSEKSINNMLDYIEKTSDDEAGRKCMEDFYSKTLDSFQNTNNERLWLKTNIKLARLWLDQKDYQRLTDKLRELHKACQREDGSDDPSKATYSMEIYSLEILMHSEQRNNKRLKLLYQRALKVNLAVSHPQTMGVIRECGGKMHMSEENWKEAQSDFFQAFRDYDEAGSLQRIQVLKYLVLTTMLMGSDINPFDSPETKAYQNDERISAMTDMVDAYQRNDINKYESVLQKNPDVTEDPFISENIEEVTRQIRTNGVLKIVAPYSRFSFDFIAARLRISVAEVQDIIGFLILDNKLDAQIDQTTGTVEIKRGVDVDRVKAVDQWASAIDSLWTTVLKNSDSTRSDDPAQFGGIMGSEIGPGHAIGGGPGLGSGMGAFGGNRKNTRKPANVRKRYTGA